MKSIAICSLVFLHLPILTRAQIEAVDVAELTLKIGVTQTEDLYYGFAEGDQIIFSVETMDGKPLKEVEIAEEPSNSKFMDYKPTSIKDQVIKVNKTAVYRFSFHNTPLGGRVCKIKIQRIPKSEDLVSFDTNWEWKTVYDTTYVPYTQDSIVGYDTTYIPYTRNELIRTDTIYDEILSVDNQIWVYSGGNMSACLGKSASCTKQMIPLDYHPNTEMLLIWVGIGQQTRDSYNKLAKGIANLAAKEGIAYLSGGSAVLVSTLTDNAVDQLINNLPTSKNVLDIFLTSRESANLWYNDYQTSIYDYAYSQMAYKDRANLKLSLSKKLGQIAPNTMTLCLKNNSKVVGVDAYVNVVAVRYNKVYADVQYKKPSVTPRKVTLNKKRAVVKTEKVRVNVG